MPSGPSESPSPREVPQPIARSQFEILVDTQAGIASIRIQRGFAELPAEYRPSGGVDRLALAIDAMTREMEVAWSACKQLSPTAQGAEWDTEISKTIKLKERLSGLARSASLIRASQQVLATISCLKESDRGAYVKNHIQEELREALDDPNTIKMTLSGPLLAVILDPQYLPSDISPARVADDINNIKKQDDSTLTFLLGKAIKEGYVPASTTLAQLKHALA